MTTSAPTVVLVHGAFADAASWSGVITELQSHGIPLAAAAFGETASAAAWKTKPSWALVAGADHAINPEVERFGAKRAGATVVEIEGASHAVAVSQPKEVAGLILDAVRATS